MFQSTNVNEARPFESEALNELFAQHHKAFLGIAHRILRSKEDSEDAVQTAYCAAFRHLHSFRGESSVKTWMTQIVVNCCLMQLRERHSRRQIALDDIEPVLASDAASPETLCYVSELETAHAAAASRLPKLLHDVYAECVISGVAFSKVVHHLGLTPAAAKARLFRARKKVENSLQLAIHGRAA